MSDLRKALRDAMRPIEGVRSNAELFAETFSDPTPAETFNALFEAAVAHAAAMRSAEADSFSGAVELSAASSTDDVWPVEPDDVLVPVNPSRDWMH